MGKWLATAIRAWLMVAIAIAMQSWCRSIVVLRTVLQAPALLLLLSLARVRVRVSRGHPRYCTNGDSET